MITSQLPVDRWHQLLFRLLAATGMRLSEAADFGTEVPAIGGNGGESLGCGLKQQSVHLGLVLVGHRADDGRKLEYEMKVRHWQKFGFARAASHAAAVRH